MATESISKKILIVDDDKAITTMVSSLLTGHGYVVLIAHDGLEGMLQVRQNTPDLILLDIMMPEINGYDVCSNLKFDERFKKIPIIVMTSREREIDARIGQLMGIDYLQKPLDSKILLEKIQKILKQ
jgi:DNA-binding response OmpR family regulator